MSWQDVWKTISARISGFSDTVTTYYNLGSDHHREPHGTVAKILLPQSQKIFCAIEEFQRMVGNNISALARQCLDNFINEYKSLDKVTHDTPKIRAVLTRINSFQSEFGYLISDNSAFIKRATERVFLYINRCIVADGEIRKKWAEAFERNEMACEKLGALMLLSYGIWAFKANAEGGRTDLILNEPLKINNVEASADGLVLTEWKIVKKKGELSKKYEQAYKQAQRYSSGILSGFELVNYRYLVIVSENKLDLPEDKRENGIIYRGMNIVVSPAVPSRA